MVNTIIKYNKKLCPMILGCARSLRFAIHKITINIDKPKNKMLRVKRRLLKFIGSIAIISYFKFHYMGT